MDEIWKQASWTPRYLVSNLGNVKNAVTGRQLSGSVNNKGYIRYDLFIDGKRVVKSGHRLVAEEFIPKVAGKNCINHLDGNKTNNRVDNLEWCTCQENRQHAVMKLGFAPVNKKPVRCVETGIIYESAREAERHTGIPNGKISLCCNKHRKTVRNTHWEFV